MENVQCAYFELGMRSTPEYALWLRSLAHLRRSMDIIAMRRLSIARGVRVLNTQFENAFCLRIAQRVLRTSIRNTRLLSTQFVSAALHMFAYCKCSINTSVMRTLIVLGEVLILNAHAQCVFCVCT